MTPDPTHPKEYTADTAVVKPYSYHDVNSSIRNRKSSLNNLVSEARVAVSRTQTHPETRDYTKRTQPAQDLEAKACISWPTCPDPASAALVGDITLQLEVKQMSTGNDYLRVAFLRCRVKFSVISRNGDDVELKIPHNSCRYSQFPNNQSCVCRL